MTDLISPALMADLRDLDESAMPSTCRVLRRTQTTTGGRTTYGPETAIATVACRLTSAGAPQELEALGRLAEEAQGTVNLPLGTDVRSGDRIEVTTGADMETFEVVGDPWPGSYSTSLAVVVQREG